MFSTRAPACANVPVQLQSRAGHGTTQAAQWPPAVPLNCWSVILRPVFLPGPGLSSLVRPLSSSGFPSYSTNKPEPKHKRRQLSQKESSKPLDVPRGQGNFKEASLQGSFQNIPFFLAPLVPTVLWRSREAFLVLPGSLKGGDRCFECVEGDIISLKDSN